MSIILPSGLTEHQADQLEGKLKKAIHDVIHGEVYWQKVPLNNVQNEALNVLFREAANLAGLSFQAKFFDKTENCSACDAIFDECVCGYLDSRDK